MFCIWINYVVNVSQKCSSMKKHHITPLFQSKHFICMIPQCLHTFAKYVVPSWLKIDLLELLPFYILFPKKVADMPCFVGVLVSHLNTNECLYIVDVHL